MKRSTVPVTTRFATLHAEMIRHVREFVRTHLATKEFMEAVHFAERLSSQVSVKVLVETASSKWDHKICVRFFGRDVSQPYDTAEVHLRTERVTARFEIPFPVLDGRRPVAQWIEEVRARKEASEVLQAQSRYQRYQQLRCEFEKPKRGSIQARAIEALQSPIPSKSTKENV